MSPEYATYLEENGYKLPREIGNGKWAALFKYMFTWAIIVGDAEDKATIADRWCYHDLISAVKGLEEFDWSTYPAQEPAGWHRHPFTGRRRGPEYEMQLALGNNTEVIAP